MVSLACCYQFVTKSVGAIREINPTWEGHMSEDDTLYPTFLYWLKIAKSLKNVEEVEEGQQEKVKDLKTMID